MVVGRAVVVLVVVVVRGGALTMTGRRGVDCCVGGG